jgi:hypothetical protein
MRTGALATWVGMHVRWSAKRTLECVWTPPPSVWASQALGMPKGSVWPLQTRGKRGVELPRNHAS